VLSAALLMVMVAAGCGGSKDVTFSRGVIHVGVGVHDLSLTKSVLGIGIGTRESQVHKRLGKPFVKAAAGRLSCWSYRADQGGSSTTEDGPSALDGLTFCMSPTTHRVAKIEIAVHG